MGKSHCAWKRYILFATDFGVKIVIRNGFSQSNNHHSINFVVKLRAFSQFLWNSIAQFNSLSNEALPNPTRSQNVENTKNSTPCPTSHGGAQGGWERRRPLCLLLNRSDRGLRVGAVRVRVAGKAARVRPRGRRALEGARITCSGSWTAGRAALVTARREELVAHDRVESGRVHGGAARAAVTAGLGARVVGSAVAARSVTTLVVVASVATAWGRK